MVKKRKKVGLAISGGYIRPTAAIGVIEVLLENNIPIDMISGCSAGSAIAAAFATGSLEKMKERLSKGTRREYWQIIFEPTMPINGFLKGQRTLEFFKEFYGDNKFEDLEIPLYITATDLNTMQPVILEKGHIAEAVRACVSVPGLFVPPVFDGKILADGAHFNQIPSAVLYQKGADYVIAVDVSHVPNIATRTLAKIRKIAGGRSAVFTPDQLKPIENPSMYEVIRRALILSSTNIDNFYHHSYKFDIIIQPEITGVKRWSVSKVGHLIKKGRRAAKQAIPQIKQDLGL